MDLTMRFLKFPDQVTGDQALRDAGLIFDSPETGPTYITASHEHSLDVIGTIYRQVLQVDPVDPENPWDVVMLDGWHANYIGTLPELLVPYEIPRPLEPYRLFAGY